MRQTAVPRVAFLLGGVVACSDPLGPPYGDPASYALPTAALYACGNWSPAQPSAAVGLFNVYFGSAGAEPTADDLREVSQAHGAVVTPFHVRGVRAIVPVAEVPGLYANMVVAVTEPGNITQRVFVGLQVPADSVLISAGGGRLISVWPSIAAAYAAVPDSLIPALRADPRVRYVEADGVACPAAAATQSR